MATQLEEQAVYDINMLRNDPSLTLQVNNILIKSAGEYAAHSQGNANLPRLSLLLKSVTAKSLQKIKSTEELFD